MDPPILHELIRTRQWESIRKAFNDSPNTLQDSNVSNVNTSPCTTSTITSNGHACDDVQKSETNGFAHRNDEQETIIHDTTIKKHSNNNSKFRKEITARDFRGRTCLHIFCSLRDEYDFEQEEGPPSPSSLCLPLDIATFLLHPDTIYTKEQDFDETPLHALCGLGDSNPKLVRLLLDYAVNLDFHNRGSKDGRMMWNMVHDLILAKNQRGCTPLHSLAEGTAPIESIRIMLEYASRNQNTISNHEHDPNVKEKQQQTRHPTLVQDEDGDTPLHWTCSAGGSIELLSVLLYPCSEALHVRNRDGHLPMHDLCTWFVSNYPKTTLDLKLRFNKLTDGILLYQEEEEHDSRMEDAPVSQYSITQEDPKSHDEEQEEDLDGVSQEEAVSYFHQRTSFLLQIAQNYPTTESQTANDTKINASINNNHHHHSQRWKPLHAAAAIPSNPPFVLEFMIMQHLDDISIPDQNGMLPLHIAASCSSSPAVQPTTDDDYLFTMITIPTLDNNGNKLRSSIPKLPSPIHTLLHIHPNAAKVWTPRTHQLPLHLAILSGNKSWNDICVLLDAAPEALTMRDGVFRLYPFMLAAMVACNNDDGNGDEGLSRGLNPLDVVLDLLLLDPELVRGGIAANMGDTSSS